MSEQELKLHVPKHARRSLVQALHRGAVTRLRLRAQYFDTPDRHLIKAGIALRLRQEGRQWIQTLKMAGEHALSRLEYNHPRPDPSLDLSLYADTPAHKVLSKHAAALGVRYETDIRREVRRVRTTAGTVEVAFDLGKIRAGILELPVSEVEFELASGQLGAIFLLGMKWQAQHGLILELRSKAERGDQLAGLAQQLAALGDLTDSAVTAARAAAVADFWAPRFVAPIALSANMTTDKGLGLTTLECLEHIARNAAILAEVDTAGICRAGTAEHVHQLRVGMRRLRSAWALFRGIAVLPPEPWQEAVKVHFAALATARDDDVLRETLMPKLNAAGQPPLRLRATPDSHASQQVAASSAFQGWLLDMLAWALGVHPLQTSELIAPTAPNPTAPEPTAPKARATLKTDLRKRLHKWHTRVLSEGLKFNELTIESKHDLRKRAKRLRYGLQFAESLLPAARLGHYRKSLSQIQDILGEMNDLYVARERFEDIREDQPPAWFAVGWIASRLDVLEKSAFQAFKELKRADQFWK
jgi:inorganic triphosphatase YgiF